MNKLSLAVQSLNAALIQARLVINPTRLQREQFADRFDKLNDKIIKMLRNSTDELDWTAYPVARSWFTQKA